jgi:TolA-binding protein
MTLLFATAAVAAAPATAQTDTLTPRVNKLEKEMRAVQRKVFPDGGTILEPEIAPQAAPQDAPGSPASSPLADLSARVSSLESQLATITGQNEENSYKIRQLEEQVKKLSADNDARLKALETPAAGAGATPVAAANPPPVAAGGAAPPPARPTNPVTTPPKTPARAAAVAAVERPASGDPAEDSYVYGYRLWQAKLYPEAETEFKALVAKYPDHKRASFAQNLLGRSYLDEGKPALASVAFYDNYQKMPRGERAPESLYWLGVSLTRLKKPADACKVYDEFGDVYGATAPVSLKTQVAEGRKAAKCP